MEILVAKSYQDLPVVREPYAESGKLYCDVKMKSGSVKKVRVYSQKEYDKMYPAPKPKWKPQRELLGFGEDGFILIFNNKPEFETFYEKGPFRYSRWIGWYLPSNETVPVLPEGIIPKILPWEVVGMDNGELKEEKQLLKDFSNFVRTS